MTRLSSSKARANNLKLVNKSPNFVNTPYILGSMFTSQTWLNWLIKLWVLVTWCGVRHWGTFRAAKGSQWGILHGPRQFQSRWSVDVQWTTGSQKGQPRAIPVWVESEDTAGQNQKCSGKTSTLGKTLGGVGLGPSHLKMVNTLCCWGPPSRLVQ